MATWDYTTNVLTRDLRWVIDEYMATHEQEPNESDRDYALRVLAELFVQPIIDWRRELDARTQAASKAQAVVKGVDGGEAA